MGDAGNGGAMHDRDMNNNLLTGCNNSKSPWETFLSSGEGDKRTMMVKNDQNNNKSSKLQSVTPNSEKEGSRVKSQSDPCPSLKMCSLLWIIAIVYLIHKCPDGVVADSQGPGRVRFPSNDLSGSRSNELFPPESRHRQPEVDIIQIPGIPWKSSKPGGEEFTNSVSHRMARVLNHKTGRDLDSSAQQNTSDESSSSSEGSSRKASPDVQDIIDGIVKLLGGKVHNVTPVTHQQRPTSPNPNTGTYNLFNPQKPVFAPKPSRINNRGPVIPINPAIGAISTQNPRLPQIPPVPNVNQARPRPDSSASFEAIPLEALNANFNLNRTNFGPPFPLHKQPGRIDPPYKKGIPLPQQLVPPAPPNLNTNNNNLNQQHSGQPPPRPLSTPANNGPGTLLVPYKKPASHVTFPNDEIEDDEAEDLRFTTNPNIPQINPAPNPNNRMPTMPVFPSATRPVQKNSSKSNLVPIQPTSSSAVVNSESVYPTLRLSTNQDNGQVEIVTQYSPIRPSESVKQLGQVEKTKRPETHLSTSSEPTLTSVATPATTLTSSHPQSIHSLPTPPLRPGIVLNDHVPATSQGVGSVEVVTVDENRAGDGQVGDVFDVTVTAKQSYGGQSTRQSFVVPEVQEEVITAPKGNQQFVSIDGKRTYFNLHSSTSTVKGHQGVAPTKTTEVITGTASPTTIEGHGHRLSQPQSSTTPTTTTTENTDNQNIGIGTVGDPVPLLPQPPGKTLFKSQKSPPRPVSTSLSVLPNNDKGVISKAPPNIIRRPLTRRPTIPPVRIDTCIVGDDTTCNNEQHEVCRTENGVSSCVCRSGYARRRHREPCRAIVSLVLSIKLDKFGDKKLTYNPDYFNPNSEIYQSLEWETIHALDNALGETTLSNAYIGSRLDAIGFDGKHAVVNSTLLIQDMVKLPPHQLKKEIQKQMIQVLTRHRNNFGKTQLWVEGPISAVSAITDLNECQEPELNDCHDKAQCINTFGSFECHCEAGYGDIFEFDRRRSGRRCDSCSGKHHCNGRGECLIENGEKVCRCSGNYYGSACDIDGEVLAVAIGASVSAVVIIGLTLACLCMWSRKWKKEEQKAALMSRTLFGGMATQALSYLGGKSTNPYQQHVSMDERLRWAQVADTNMSGNIYVQNDPLTMHSNPGGILMETPPMMTIRRSAEAQEAACDDIFDERPPTTKRPRSRASQLQGSIYYDLEPEAPQSDIYASRSMMHFPTQFCVPMTPMGHYAHSNRAFYT